jgi:hypothetical protein
MELDDLRELFLDENMPLSTRIDAAEAWLQSGPGAALPEEAITVLRAIVADKNNRPDIRLDAVKVAAKFSLPRAGKALGTTDVQRPQKWRCVMNIERRRQLIAAGLCPKPGEPWPEGYLIGANDKFEVPEGEALWPWELESGPEAA